MKVKITADMVKELRALPGMETERDGVREMTPVGDAILTTAMMLPRRKAKKLIRWIAQEWSARHPPVYILPTEAAARRFIEDRIQPARISITTLDAEIEKTKDLAKQVRDLAAKCAGVGRLIWFDRETGTEGEPFVDERDRPTEGGMQDDG